MKIKQNGFGALAIIILIALVLAAAIFLLKQNGKMPGYGSQSSSSLQNSSDLDTASADLDNTSPDEMDTNLNQLNSDSSSF